MTTNPMTPDELKAIKADCENWLSHRYGLKLFKNHCLALLAHIDWLDNLVTEYDTADPTELETKVLELSDRIIELSQTLQIKEVELKQQAERIKELQSIPLEDALQAKVDKLVEALRFYADPINWMVPGDAEVDKDCGAWARQALAAHRGEGGGV